MDYRHLLKRFGGSPWATPVLRDYVQPALTSESVNAAQAQLGVVLPGLYLHMLRQQSGGHMRIENAGTSLLYGIGPRFPSITRDEAWWRPKRIKPGHWAPVDPQLLIPFNGDGHWDLCFDYRQAGPQAEPAVGFVSCSSEYERPIAPSFDDFIAQAHDTMADCLRLYVDVSPKTVATRLAEALSAKPPSVQDHNGYDEWLVNRHDGESFWSSSNRVPSGYRRVEHTIIRDPELGLQLPEDPACTVLVSTSPDWHAECQAALRELGLLSDGPAA